MTVTVVATVAMVAVLVRFGAVRTISGVITAPHFGHALAVVLTLVPHSVHLIKAIIPPTQSCGPFGDIMLAPRATDSQKDLR